MEKKNQKMNLSSRYKVGIFGLLLILVGLLFLAFNFGWINSELRSVIFSWPMIFIIIAIFNISDKRFSSALIWFLLGLFFLIPRIAIVHPKLLPGIDSNFAKYYWPVLLIFLGIGILFKILFERKKTTHIHINNDEKKQINIVDRNEGVYERRVIFGGIKDVFLEPVFRGGKIDVTFGGVEVDLRRTSLPEGDTYIYAQSVFGGITLFLPDDWIVVPEVSTIMGGIENKHLSTIENSDSTRRLIIYGEVIFGGVEIK